MRVDCVESGGSRRPRVRARTAFFEITKADQAQGAIAQLGERLVCNQKVAGSIPAGSTRSTKSYTACHESYARRSAACMPHGMRILQIRVCSLKIRQFVLTLKRKRSAYGLNVAFENQLIKLL